MIRIAIADDYPLFRKWLKIRLSAEADLAVVAEATTGDELLDAVRRTTPDFAIVDISMPGPGWIPLLRELRESSPDLFVIVLSGHAARDYATVAHREGATGYLSKDRARDELVDVIRSIHASEASRPALAPLNIDNEPG